MKTPASHAGCRSFVVTAPAFLRGCSVRSAVSSAIAACGVVLLLCAAAAQGHLKAMISLGNLFAFYKTPADEKQAFEWFTMAAERCDPEGQFMVGLGHFEGKTLARDLPAAWMWLTLASLRGHLLAEVTQHAIQDKFSAADIAAGAERALEWRCKS